jgi:uncharacterized protein YndB with AHSA1/START domain
MAERLPPADARHLVERLTEAPVGRRARRWVLRDDNQQHYHGVVRLSDSPVLIELRWKLSSDAPEQSVGCFALHLPELLAADLVRFEREEVAGNEVRVRFYRGSGGVVYIQTRSDGPSLPIGTVALT